MNELFPQEIKDIVLRDYQAASIERLRQNIRAKIRNQVLCIATGGGKTVCAAHLLHECHLKGKHGIMVVDRIPLVDQTSRTLDSYGIPHGVIQGDHWRRNDEPIQIASAQTLIKRGWPKADLIIVDECHTLIMNIAKRIALRDAITIGLSATPFTPGLAKYYDTVVNVTTTNRLTQEGFLVPFRVFSASEPDMTGAKVVAGEWTDSECATRAMPVVGDAVAEYLKHGRHGKFIAFGCTVKHCEELQRQFFGAGILTSLYTSKTTDVERTAIVNEFRKPHSTITGLISVAALSKGFNVPDVSVIIMCRPLRKSLAEHIQILGRGLRPFPGKKECIVLDHSGNCLRFWNEMNEFFEEGISELDAGKEKAKSKPQKEEPAALKCPTCHFVHHGAPVCPSCGYVYPKKSSITHEAGQLREIGTINASREVRQDFYSQLLYIADERKHKAGWAAHKYKAKFGVWPRNLSAVPKPPEESTRNWVRSQMIAFSNALKKGSAA